MSDYLAGACYRNALRWARTNFFRYPNLVIVHGGIVESNGLLYGHAWIETTPSTYVDPGYSAGHTCLYYHKYRIDYRQCRYYTLRELVALMTLHRHVGPYHDIPGAILGYANE